MSRVALIRIAALGVLVASGFTTAILAIQDSQGPDAAAYAAEQARLDRLGVIAGELYNPKADTAALFTEAAKLCGFSIWNENGEKIFVPKDHPKLGYAITEEEIKWFAQMQKSGNGFKFGSVIEALDVTWKGLGGEGSCGLAVTKMLRKSYQNKNSSVRAWGSFLESANAQNPNRTEAAYASTESVLSPVETLFLLRVATEEMTRHVRAWLKTKEKNLLYASINPSAQMGLVPGWLEDATSAVLMEGADQFISHLEGLVTSATTLAEIEAYKSIAGKINAALAILKVAETYATLKCEFRVLTPGQPLIRTTNRNPGEVRTVQAHWYFDAPAITDWLKDNRWVVHALGIDPDAPHSGHLAGVETDWQIVRDTGGLVQTHVDLSKVLTDSKGVASVDFEGKPQSVDMNRNQVAPVEKVVQLQCTPQTKATSAGQDIVDALTGALGIMRGGLGFATPIIESMYRLKWVGTKGYRLQVRDWVPGETRGNITITVHGYGSTTAGNGNHWVSLDRYIQYENVVMEDMGSPPPPKLNLDPGVSALVRQQAQETYDMMLEASKSRPFILEGPGTCFMAINDLSGGTVEAGDCGPSHTGSNKTSATGRKTRTFKKGDAFTGQIEFDTGFSLTLDLKTMKAVMHVADNLDPVNYHSESDVEGTIVRSDYKGSANLLKEVMIDSRGFQIPITQAEDLGSKKVVFKGSKDIRFHFGPEDRWTGTCHVEFELIRVPKKAP
jgi:hypothetical protein